MLVFTIFLCLSCVGVLVARQLVADDDEAPVVCTHYLGVAFICAGLPLALRSGEGGEATDVRVAEPSTKLSDRAEPSVPEGMCAAQNARSLRKSSRARSQR